MSIIPLPYYTPIFYNTLLIVLFGTYLKIRIDGGVKNKLSAFLVLTIVVLYLGLRPISGAYFADMGIYNRYFEYYRDGGEIVNSKDVFWHLFMKTCSGFLTAKYFFLLCGILYIYPLYLACKNWFGKHLFVPFLMFLASFSFWPYGTNGIRNGIATSLVVLAFSLDKKGRKWSLLLLAISFFIHSSTIIPIAAYIITLFVKKPKIYLIGWLTCIPLSIVLGGFWENLFASLGFNDERIGYLTQGNINNDNFAYTGFRWDFLFYSAIAIYAGYFFIIKKRFNDEVYNRLFNIFATANAFWILVIRANFSNRFAYLSWFMMAIVIFYPFFKQKMFYNQSKVLGRVVLLYYFFTYALYILTT